MFRFNPDAPGKLPANPVEKIVADPQSTKKIEAEKSTLADRPEDLADHKKREFGDLGGALRVGKPLNIDSGAGLDLTGLTPISGDAEKPLDYTDALYTRPQSSVDSKPSEIQLKADAAIESAKATPEYWMNKAAVEASQAIATLQEKTISLGQDNTEEAAALVGRSNSMASRIGGFMKKLRAGFSETLEGEGSIDVIKNELKDLSDKVNENGGLLKMIYSSLQALASGDGDIKGEGGPDNRKSDTVQETSEPSLEIGDKGSVVDRSESPEVKLENAKAKYEEALDELTNPNIVAIAETDARAKFKKAESELQSAENDLFNANAERMETTVIDPEVEEFIAAYQTIDKPRRSKAASELSAYLDKVSDIDFDAEAVVAVTMGFLGEEVMKKSMVMQKMIQKALGKTEGVGVLSQEQRDLVEKLAEYQESLAKPGYRLVKNPWNRGGSDLFGNKRVRDILGSNRLQNLGGGPTR